MKGFLAFLLVLAPFAIPVIITGEEVAAAIGFVIYAIIILGYILWRKTPAYKKRQEKLAEEQKAREAELAEIRACYSFNKDKGVFTLKKRSPLLSKVVQIKDSSDVYIKYEPVKLHIGAATVGGVTTGGAYTTGGYNYIAAEKKNGLCTLECGGEIIRKIKLSDTLYSEASKSIVSDYLDEKAKQISVIDDVRLDEYERRQALENFKTQGYVGNTAANRGKPTLEKGMKILDWITTEE